jgi:hypothetical protein
MVALYPIVKLDAQDTYEVFRVVLVECIVVRLQARAIILYIAVIIEATLSALKILI